MMRLCGTLPTKSISDGWSLHTDNVQNFRASGCPTGVADCARAFGLNIGSAGDDAKAGEASPSDSFLRRSSLHVAHGQFSRKYAKSKWLTWPSAHAMSTPAPLLR